MRAGQTLAGAVIAIAATATASAEPTPPRVDFMLHCQGCHLPDGGGIPDLVPPLKDHVARFVHSEAGRAFLVQVPGVAQSFLSDERLAAVMNWMLTEFDAAGIPADFSPYTAAEVGRWRQQPERHVTETRTRILRATAASGGGST